MLQPSKLERHGHPTVRAGPTYRWNPRGLHVPTAGLTLLSWFPSPSLFSGVGRAKKADLRQQSVVVRTLGFCRKQTKNVDINNRARTLLGDISSWSGASSLLVRGHRILQLDGVSVRLPTAASLQTHRQAARIPATRPPPLSTFFRGRGIVRSQKTRAKRH